jgi:hypothetical protein
LVSTLNDLSGTIVANAAIVPAGTGGSIDVYATNNTDIIIDINGYYAAFFGTPTAGYAFPNASGTPLMTIAPGGNVGIGTPTPASTLDVAGDINMSGRLLYKGTAILATDPYNTATGFQALSSNIGSFNTATGSQALLFNTSGSNNTATGFQALYFNTQLAAGPGEPATGSNNTATGLQALYFNTTGSGNTAIGEWALASNTTGNNNIAIGYHAARAVISGNSNNIHIGNPGEADDYGTIRIGSTPSTSYDCFLGGIGRCRPQGSFFAAGIRGTTTANNDAVPVLIDGNGQLGTVNSSRRYKEDIKDMGDASSGLMRLRPVTFRYQKPFADGSKPVQYGLIAEEVAEVYPDLVAHSVDGQIETVKYQVLDSMLLNEVQRLNKENQALQERLSRLEATMATVASGAGVQ